MLCKFLLIVIITGSLRIEVLRKFLLIVIITGLLRI